MAFRGGDLMPPNTPGFWTAAPACRVRRLYCAPMSPQILTAAMLGAALMAAVSAAAAPRACLPDSRAADLAHAELGGLDLVGARLAHADLTGANLTDATLMGATLSAARLNNVELTAGRCRRAAVSRRPTAAYRTRTDTPLHVHPAALMLSAPQEFSPPPRPATAASIPGFVLWSTPPTLPMPALTRPAPSWLPCPWWYSSVRFSHLGGDSPLFLIVIPLMVTFQWVNHVQVRIHLGQERITGAQVFSGLPDCPSGLLNLI